jgi:hypothetical protein
VSFSKDAKYIWSWRKESCDVIFVKEIEDFKIVISGGMTTISAKYPTVHAFKYITSDH